MNKSNVRQKRSIGKDSPLSKRPKLDFTLRSRESPRKSKDNICDPPNGCNGIGKDKIGGNAFERKREENVPTASDWDDDFSGDMLEKVCLIADLSQAMVNSQPVPKELDKEKIDFEIFEGSKPPAKRKNSVPPLEATGSTYEKLKLEFEKVQEKLKTKEGEVHILRSQLKQNEDAKQALALQNIKVIDEIQKKFNEKITLTEKDLETTKSKLQFKDLEYKTLSERCKQLEYNISKSKLSDGGGEAAKSLCGPSQGPNQKSHTKETENESKLAIAVDNSKKVFTNFEFCPPVQHEGNCLAKTICPEFFSFIDETNVVPFYTFPTDNDAHKFRADLDKREKYKWSNLPRQTVFIKDLYNSVTSLFAHESFLQKEAKETVRRVLESCGDILAHQKEVLLFLEKLQLTNSECDDADQSLLDNERPVEILTVKHLLNGVKLNEEECGVEGRRALALVYALMGASPVAFDLVKSNHGFATLLRDTVAAIGNLRRPLRYTGILVGVTFVVQKLLRDKNLGKRLLGEMNEIVEEVIFARPKLDVLREVVNALAGGKHHLGFQAALCRNASVNSCALYMDSKLKQAMFFTKKACPLKLLCMQMMGLACLPSSRGIRWDLTNCVIKWLNNASNAPNFKLIKWLPVNSVLTQEDRCFNVTECLLYLMTLCLKDYNLGFPPQETPDEATKRGRRTLISIIGHGAVLLKRILKADHERHLHDNTYFVRFAVLLKTLLPSKSELCHANHLSHVSPVQAEAISWITDLLESDLRNQDCCLKQNTSALPDADVFNALKINDDSKIY